jgi:glycosyltransferase involved in cell wall biosynthesis
MNATRPVRLAVHIDQPLRHGGGYQQAMNVAFLVRQLPAEVSTPLFVTTIAENVAMLRSLGIEVAYFPFPLWRRIALDLRALIRLPGLVRLVRRLLGGNSYEDFLTHLGVDLVYFASPSRFFRYLERLNYVFTVWDLCHLDDPEFPEVRNDREFEDREAMYGHALTKAVAVLVDSGLGKRNVVRRYGVDDSRVHVMPFAPAVGTQISEVEYAAGFINIKSRYGLDMDYVFYPAQFWAHKNHVYLLHGLNILEKYHGIRLAAVFAGSDRDGNMEYLKRVARELGLFDRIRFAGFVPNEEIPYLYKQSVALVMPSYFGPTNLPPLEAFSLGVPVLYPDKQGLKEQVGDAALLMDLHDPASMARHLANILAEPELRNTLVARGREKLGKLSAEGQVLCLANILGDFQVRRACWA